VLKPINMWINDIADPFTGCFADVIFVVDQSGSVGISNNNNSELVTSFLSQLVGRLDIDSGATRVGLVEFSSNVNTAEAFNLNAHSSVADVQSAISPLDYNGGGTNTAAALRYVRTTMLTTSAGERTDVRNVVVVLTDGKSNINASQTPVSTVWKLIIIIMIDNIIYKAP